MFDSVESLHEVEGAYARNLMPFVSSLSELVECVLVVGRGAFWSESRLARHLVSVQRCLEWKCSWLNDVCSSGMEHIGR